MFTTQSEDFNKIFALAAYFRTLVDSSIRKLTSDQIQTS